MKAVLLDRDGVINRDSPDYIRSTAEWTTIPGSLEAIAALKRAGFPVAICTNQSGVARGLLSETDLEAIHERLRAQLAAVGAGVDGIFACLHGPEASCRCRKPAPGLIEQACTALGVKPTEVVFIGDSGRDLEAARRSGARPWLVRTGNGAATLARGEAADAVVHDDLAAAARALIHEHPVQGAG